MQKNELWENDCESSKGELKSVAYTIISLAGGLVALAVSLFVIIH